MWPRKRTSTLYRYQPQIFAAKKHLLAAGIVLAILFMPFAYAHTSPSPAKNRPPLATTTSSTLASHEIVSPVIAHCTRTETRFNGNTAFDCHNEETTIHYEYIDSPEHAMQLIETYQLRNTPESSPTYLRTGIVELKTRLLALDTTTGVVIDITSNYGEEILLRWWNDYIKNNGEKTITEETSTPQEILE